VVNARRDLHEQNRRSWNAGTIAHNSHKGDQAAFLRGGGSTVFPEELELLGSVDGLDLLHLQCNSGQDTLSLAALGARVTGVDISDEAVAFATRLSADSGIPGTFVRADVYDWLADAAPERFDVVFASYGALVWLSDLTSWARGIAGVLRPGGRLVVLDFHPLWGMVDWDWQITKPYFGDGPQLWAGGIGDYVAMAREGLVPWGYQEGVGEFTNPHPVHEFQWTVADIVTAVLAAGLRLETLREYPYSNGAVMGNGMRDTGGRRLVPPEPLPTLPLMLGVVGAKPAG